MKATRFTDSVAHQGEGPVWWATTGELRFVDMLHGAVVAFTPTGETYRLPVDSPVAEDLSDLAPCTPPFVPAGQRLNEGGCDPDDAVTTPAVATPTVVTPDVTISNGLGWSPDGARAYYIDTPTRTVSLLDYSRDAGLTDRRPWVVPPEEAGRPDGLTVDAEGGVWVALNGGSAVHRDDDAGRLSAVVEVGARKVTACAFGGRDLDTLFITTSREDLAPDEEPAAGSLYAVAPGVRGLPPLPFRG